MWGREGKDHQIMNNIVIIIIGELRVMKCQLQEVGSESERERVRSRGSEHKNTVLIIRKCVP